MPRKRPITVEERRALRRWAQQQVPRPTQRQCIEWFERQYHHKLSQSTISESLSSNFEALDKTQDTGIQRRRLGQWPKLEKILWEWQIQIEERGGFTTGDILQQKAQQIWKRLPEYDGQECPSFSTGWLEKFKKRHHIRSRQQFGEAASVPENVEEEMRALRTIAGEFQEEDIYNMDETGLFWKMMPSRGLSSQQQSGIKKNKTRISLVFCVNATGTDRLPVWAIGHAKAPRALQRINIATMGAQWRANKKA